MDDKASLRAHMREVRLRLGAERPDAPIRAARAFTRAPLLAASDGALSRLLDLLKPDPVVAATYAPMGGELDPGPLEQTLASLGVAIAHPVVLEAGAPLIFRERRPGEAPVRDAAGASAPGPQAPEVTPSLLFVPCLAFDGDGGRLGQGGGYYDRTLLALRNQGRATAIGLAYAGQEVDKLPLEPHDAPLDGVLTEAGLRLFARNR